MNRSLPIVFCTLLILLGLPDILAQDSGWPRTVPLERGTVTFYSPQVDEMRDGVLHFRAALAYRATAGSEPVFGAGWFESPVEIDSAGGIVHLTGLKMTETRFPDGTDDVQAGLATALARQSTSWNLDFPLAELEAALERAGAESLAEEQLNTAPPRIIYRDHPALLVSIDGEAVLREIENSPYEAVVNTPYPLIHDGRYYYLNAARDVWYRADSVTGPYRYEARPPVDMAAMVEADESDAEAEPPAVAVTAANAPEIVVSTEPAELLVTEGPAAFVPLVDDLLVLQNSDDDVFMHVGSQDFYIVLAGRWYRARSLDGPWAYQPADELPAAFADIPRESDQADSRVHVAGTREARDAVLDVQVPQTAAVARGEVDIDVEYDGEPLYRPVDGTDLVYIENTGSTVLVSDGLYYLVEDGVWYLSASPDGPWQVATERPAQVDTILPTSPVHNVKYVHVYDSTPQVVYVGYTPGYFGSYVYHDTIFYGSGWNYRPWVSPRYYYPRHSTWGWNASYHPWSGWSFGLSWGWGPFNVGWYSGGYWHRQHYWHHRHYGRWGPGGYRPRHYTHYDSGRRDRGYRDDRRGGRETIGQRRNDNLYRDGEQRARIVDSRDQQQREPGTRNGDRRQASLVTPGGSGERERAGNRAGRNTTGPVRRSDLRRIAEARDDDFAAKSKGAGYRTQPVPPVKRPANDRSRVMANNERRARRPAQSTADTSLLLSRARAAVKPPMQRRPRDAGVPEQSSRQSSREPIQRAANTNRSAHRLTSAVTNSQPERNISRPGPKPRNTGRISDNRPAPARPASRESKQKAEGPRARSNRGADRRVGDRHSR